MSVYHPTYRERLLQEIIRSHRDAERITRERRAAKRAYFKATIIPWLLIVAAAVLLLLGLLDWESLL